MSWLSKAVGKVTGAVKSIGRAVDFTSSKSLIRKGGRAIDRAADKTGIKAAGRAIDLTYSKSLISKATGGKLVSVARMAVATAKIGTGAIGLEWLASKTIARGTKVGDKLNVDVKRTAVEGAKGYATGAAVGMAIMAGKGISGALGTVLGNNGDGKPVEVATNKAGLSGGVDNKKFIILGAIGVGAAFLIAAFWD